MDKLADVITQQNVCYPAVVYYLFSWPEYRETFSHTHGRVKQITEEAGPVPDQRVKRYIERYTEVLWAFTVAMEEMNSMTGAAAFEGFVGLEYPNEYYGEHLGPLSCMNQPLAPVPDYRESKAELPLILRYEHCYGAGVRAGMIEPMYRNSTAEEMKNDPFSRNVIGLKFTDKQLVNELQDLSFRHVAGFYNGLWVGVRLGSDIRGGIISDIFVDTRGPMAEVRLENMKP